MLDLKILKQAIDTLGEEKRLDKNKVKEAVERSFSAAYQKEYGQRGQIIKCNIDFENNNIDFKQIKIVVDNNTVRMEDEEVRDNDPRFSLPKYNEERHIMIDDAKLFKNNIELGEEISFDLDGKYDFGRIALQNAKQAIVGAIKDIEREEILNQFEDKLDSIVYGSVERVDNYNAFIDIGPATAIMPREEQINGERLSPGAKVKAYMYSLEDTPRGLSIKLSRTHPKFLEELLKAECIEIQDGIVEIVSVAREPGSRSKIAARSNDDKVDPVGTCVGQRGTRINGISNELRGERIDIIVWDENVEEYIKRSISPAKTISVEINQEEKSADIKVSPQELSLAIGKRGQNVRLAARLTGYKLNIIAGEEIVTDDNIDEYSDIGENY